MARRCLFALLVLLAAARTNADDALPRVFLIDPHTLVETRTRATSGDPALEKAMARLRREADHALREGPYSVMDKKSTPPSGDKHDYMSVGPYWWPDPNKPDGKPYIRRDGEVNPERHQYDNVSMGRMGSAVETLALAYYLTGDERYAAHAAKLLRVWFLDPATRMNPNLNYGQAIPGRCDGRGVGIIDTLRLPRVVDAIGMLDGSEAWTSRDQEQLQAWFADYLRWLRDSKLGRDESRARNNHGTWYDVQVADFALFAGQRELAREVLAAAAERRIATQIEPDGRQPHELARTKSFSYSSMNLLGMMALATLAQRVDVDLWNFQTADGRSIRRALDWLLPYVSGDKEWTHKQIAPFHPSALALHLRMAAGAYREPKYEKLLAKLANGDANADRENLLYPSQSKP